MKRPLVFICIAFVATILIYLQLSLLPSMENNDNSVIKYMEGNRITFLGEVYQKEHKNQKLVLYLKNVKFKNQNYFQINEFNNKIIDLKKDLKTNGQIMCYMYDAAYEPKIGSEVLVEGKVAVFKKIRNPGEFDQRLYYAVQKIDLQLWETSLLKYNEQYSIYYENLYCFRRYLEGIYDKILNEKDASIMKAIVLGNKSELDAESKQLYQKTGIAHVFAISGLHITFLGIGFYELLRKIKVPVWCASIMAIMLMIMYGNMVGMSSSAYRAVLMFVIKMSANIVKRTYDMLTAVCLVAVLMIFEQPLYLTYAGFLLSFGAILGVGCILEIFKIPKYGKDKLIILKRQKEKSFNTKFNIIKCELVNKITEALSAGLSIFMIHFPIMLSNYYEFSVYSFILNLVIIPAMTIVMTAGLICLILGMFPIKMAGISLGICMAKLLGIICHILLSAFEFLSKLSLRLPYANWIVGKPDIWKILVFYGIVLFMYVMHQYCSVIYKKRITKGLIGIPLNMKYMLAIVAILIITSHSYDGLRIAFLDVGQGDCIWIENEKGHHYLIDGGSTSEKKVGQYSILPYLKYTGSAKIEAVFLTHLDEDHISGIMELIEGIDGVQTGINIGSIVIPKAAIKDDAYDRILNICRQHNISLLYACTGNEITDGNLHFRVMHPESNYSTDSRNAYSLVMQMLYMDEKKKRNTGALFTGDVELDGEQKVVEYILQEQSDGSNSIWDKWHCDIYKAAHHGSKYSNSEQLINLIKPDTAIISCGENNRYGHPHSETLERLKNVNSQILRTDEMGAVIIGD